MGYCIEYNKIPIKRENKRKRRCFKAFSVLIFLLGAVALGLIPQVRGLVAGIVFPGIGAEGIDAFDKLVSQLWNGMPLDEAFHSFCIQVFSSVNG